MFESGDLGDDAEWFEFLFAYRAYEHVSKAKRIGMPMINIYKGLEKYTNWYKRLEV